MFLKQFNEYDPTRKLQMLKKLREIVDLDSSHLNEREVKTTSRGRPHTKINTSTRREWSEFKILSSMQDSYSPLVTTSTSDTLVQSYHSNP